MLVSTKGRYGLRMMIDIARHQDEGNVSLREIGERQGISVKYLEQLARSLCAAGLLEGSRGQGGGYALARPARCITAGAILRATEGSTAPVSCLVGGDDEHCPRQHDCETAAFWLGLDKMIAAYVNGYTLEDLVNDSQECSDPGPCIAAPHRVVPGRAAVAR